MCLSLSEFLLSPILHPLVTPGGTAAGFSPFSLLASATRLSTSARLRAATSAGASSVAVASGVCGAERSGGERERESMGRGVRDGTMYRGLDYFGFLLFLEDS